MQVKMMIRRLHAIGFKTLFSTRGNFLLANIIVNIRTNILNCGFVIATNMDAAWGSYGLPYFL